MAIEIIDHLEDKINLLKKLAEVQKMDNLLWRLPWISNTYTIESLQRQLRWIHEILNKNEINEIDVKHVLEYEEVSQITRGDNETHIPD